MGPSPPPSSSRTAALVCAGLCLLSAGLIALLVFVGPGFPGDRLLPARAHALGGPHLDSLMLLLSDVGGTRVRFALVLVATAVLLVLRRWQSVLVALVGVGGTSFVNVRLKDLFERPRPSSWPSIAPETTFAFPSGHAMGSAALATGVILLAWGTKLRWVVVVAGALFAGAVGTSRVYLGVHYPSDVAAGWCLGVAWVLAAALVTAPPRRTGGPSVDGDHERVAEEA